MTQNRLLTFAFLAAAPVCLAQGSDVHHYNVSIGGGAAVPIGSASGYLGTAPMLRVGFGYRFNRLFQADAGFQMAFGAANNQNPVITDAGTVQGGDHEFMIPLGGRVYLPLPMKRIEASVGAGVAHLHYSETAPSVGYGYQNNCYTCTSRGGWGGYGLGNVSYFLDDNHNFRVGTTLEYVAASTNGDAVGNVPALKTTDHWMTVTVGLGLSF